MIQPINIALIGASGVVGTKIIQLLENKSFAINNFYPLGSSSIGQEIELNGSIHTIDSIDNFDFHLADLAIFSAGSDVAEKYAKEFVEAGSYVIDLSSHFRYEEEVPLIIPEINASKLESLQGPALIANPNCSTSQLLMALKPIHDNLTIEFINIATYQAVSGTGKAAIDELNNQTYFSESNHEPSVYPKQIAFNVIPQCDVFLDNGYTKEEMKLVWETHKILDPNIDVQATCVRVPVFNGHSEAVFFKTNHSTSREALIELLENTPGIKVVDDPDLLEYPTPIEHANDTEEVFVGRIRVQEFNNDTWVSLWVVADNVYGKGAALNAVQIAQTLVDLNKF
ncbi:MAG: aspartate-semialdehyde dehydrogenase [Gammaproteobacteria bacterium]